VSAEAIRGLIDAHSQSDAVATMVTTILEDPAATGGSCATPPERGARGGDQGPRDCTPEELGIDEVNTGIFMFDGAPSGRRCRG